MALEIITTGDGSHSLLNRELNETYHSVHGALRESLHVFIKHGLSFFHDKYDSKDIAVFEVGFGTGLNALLTAEEAATGGFTVHYTSIEAYPLEEAVWADLNYAPEPAQKERFARLHRSAWQEWVEALPRFHLKKLNTTLQTVALQAATFDIIYFDAFAPSKQPDMWTLPMLEKVVKALKPGGVFVTYCAKGQLKRDLKSLGLEVETLEGPPGKKEMVRGVLPVAL